MILPKKYFHFTLIIFFYSCERKSHISSLEILEICIPKIFVDYKMESIELKTNNFKGIMMSEKFFHIKLKNQGNSISTNYTLIDGNLFQLGKSENCILLKQEFFLTPNNEVITDLNAYYKGWNSLEKISYLSNRNLSLKKSHSSYFSPMNFDKAFCD
jgi:hypothetical protein